MSHNILGMHQYSCRILHILCFLRYNHQYMYQSKHVYLLLQLYDRVLNCLSQYSYKNNDQYYTTECGVGY